MREYHFGIILLGAGASIRMGRPKQLITLAGTPMIRWAAETAVNSGSDNVVIVLGANAEVIRSSLSGLSIYIVVNSEWQTGMASSIRCGMKALLGLAPKTTQVLLMLGDQPNVSAASLQKIMDAGLLAESGLVVARYNNGIGTPALFSRKHFDCLLKIEGTGGAKSLLERHRNEIVEVELPEASQDLDTPEDLAAYRSANESEKNHSHAIA